MCVLWIVGEAKSGKSELAEEIFARLPGKKFYIGTLPRTPQWMSVIEKHAERRPKDWKLIEITDKLATATDSVKRDSKNGVATVLLDGWGVYVQQKTLQLDDQNVGLTMVDETRFVDRIYSEYHQLVSVCDYLIIVDHISAEAPAMSDYKSNRISWRMKAVVSRCVAEADKAIYHDEEDVSHKDKSYVAQIARELVAWGNISE